MDYSGTYNGSKSKWQIWTALNNGVERNLAYFLPFCVKISMQSAHVPSICSDLVSFKVQTTLDVQ